MMLLQPIIVIIIDVGKIKQKLFERARTKYLSWNLNQRFIGQKGTFRFLKTASLKASSNNLLLPKNFPKAK